VIFALQERFDEANAILAECRQVFREYGDMTRSLQAGMAQGSSLYEASRYEDARQLYLELLTESTAEGDIESQAGFHNNLGYCETRLSNYVSANIHFSEAVARFTDLGFTAEVARTARGAGLILIARGQVTSGLARLREARRNFTADGMIEEAGLCGLNIVAVLIERGERTAARELAQNVIDEFIAAQISERAINAVIELRDAIDVDDATAETVHTVHALVENLRYETGDFAN
jgi:tetratricopeptide (TPR) repeat protein